MIFEQQILDDSLIQLLSEGCLRLGVSTPENASRVREALKESGFHFFEDYDLFNGDWDFKVYSSEELKKAKEAIEKT